MLKHRILEVCVVGYRLLADGTNYVQGEVVVLATQVHIVLITKIIERLTMNARMTLNNRERVQGLASSDFEAAIIRQVEPFQKVARSKTDGCSKMVPAARVNDAIKIIKRKKEE